jgi:hypothetical protein
MALVEITTLNSGTIYVAAGSVSRVTRGIDNASGLTRTGSGNEHQFANVGVRETGQSLRTAGAKLPEFAAPDSSPVFLSVLSISAVRTADPNVDPPADDAVIAVAGQRQSVHQTVRKCALVHE